MRSDTNLQRRLADEGVDARVYGSMPGVLDTNTEVEGRRVLRSHSFSGRENNSVFYNRGGRSFTDISGISGLDSIADSRAFAYFDYDRDGRLDIVLTNTNEPQLQLFRNETPDPGKVVQVRLVGGNRNAQANSEWSPRDGYGAHVIVEAGELRMRRELRCGDGFAAQNSSTLAVGLGAGSPSATIKVEWPSGKSSSVKEVPAGSLVTIYENPGESQFVVSTPPASAPTRRTGRPELTILPRLDLPLPPERPQVSLVVCMATSCAVCRSELPHLRRLSKAFGRELALFGLPVDPDDTEAKLTGYANELSPPYRILGALADHQREALEAHLKANFGDTPLPTSLLISQGGRVLATYKGTPTLSDLRNAIP